jgi:hypothetical protein
MHISIELTKSGKTFGIAFRKSEKDEKPFFVSKGNRIASRKDGSGEFVSGPSAKMDDGTFLNYTFMDSAFGDYVLALAKASQPKTVTADIDNEVPF